MPVTVLLPDTATGYTNSANAIRRDDTDAVATHSWTSGQSGTRPLYLTYPIATLLPEDAIIRHLWFAAQLRSTNLLGNPSCSMLLERAQTGTTAGGNQGSWTAIHDRVGDREAATGFFVGTTLTRVVSQIVTGSYLRGQTVSGPDTARPHGSSDLRRPWFDNCRLQVQWYRSAYAATTGCEVGYVELYVDWVEAATLRRRLFVAAPTAVSGAGTLLSASGALRAPEGKGAAAPGSLRGGGVAARAAAAKAAAGPGSALGGGTSASTGAKAATATGGATAAGSPRGAGAAAFAGPGIAGGSGGQRGSGAAAKAAPGSAVGGGTARGAGLPAFSGTGTGRSTGGGGARSTGHKTATAAAPATGGGAPQALGVKTATAAAAAWIGGAMAAAGTTVRTAVARMTGGGSGRGRSKIQRVSIRHSSRDRRYAYDTTPNTTAPAEPLNRPDPKSRWRTRWHTYRP